MLRWGMTLIVAWQMQVSTWDFRLYQIFADGKSGQELKINEFEYISIIAFTFLLHIFLTREWECSDDFLQQFIIRHRNSITAIVQSNHSKMILNSQGNVNIYFLSSGIEYFNCPAPLSLEDYFYLVFITLLWNKSINDEPNRSVLPFIVLPPANRSSVHHCRYRIS
jgi:hypothetical protein